MEDEDLHDEDLPEKEFNGGGEGSLVDLTDDDEGALVEEEDEVPLESGQLAAGWEWKPPALAVAHEAKLRELLGNLCVSEVRIYSDASKEFVALLKGESGANFLLEYVRSSPKLAELVEAWRLHQGKPGISYILTMIAEVIGHPFGMSRASSICHNIDNFVRSIIISKLNDLYAELKSEENRRQAAALFLLAAMVRRGVILASELAKNFHFDLPVLKKLSDLQKSKRGKEAKRRMSRSTRRAFVEFAMSFLEVGNPRMLRWILQQKDMYSGVLRGLGSDDQETVVYVLSVLRDKVLCADSLVPPGLRSVLFGSMTLEQLSFISGNPDGGDASDLAHEVLLMVCTDPCNGLMPHGNLKGNVKRLSDLMMKLKATESPKHKELLLAIVKGRPLLCSSYMDEFPYHLEPRASPQWYSAVSLAADLISSVNFCTSFSFLEASKNGDPPCWETAEVQCILKCILPRSCSRLVINKGLLHSDILVQHGSIRLLLEALKLLDTLNGFIGRLMDSMHTEQSPDLSYQTNFLNFSGTSDDDVGENDCISSRSSAYLQKWVSLRRQIQDEVRSALPDPQVLLKLLTSFTNETSRTSSLPMKRRLNNADVSRKKTKCEVNKAVADEDIVLSVTGSAYMDEIYEKNVDANVTDTKKQSIWVLSEIWGPKLGVDISKSENIMSLFHAKLLDALKLYLRALPLTLEGSFDFMKILTNNPSNLSMNLQESVISLLLEYIGQVREGQTSIKVPPMMYKSLHLLLGLLVFSPIQTIQGKVFTLAKTAMISTGAFDHNISEVEAWLLFLPGNNKDKRPEEFQGAFKLKELSSVVISFLCDAVSTVANSLYKCMDQLRMFFFRLNEQEDICPDFSPLVICILQKCIRVLESDSRTFKLSEKSMISLYVHNTLSFILQTQVNLKILPGTIIHMLKEKLNEHLLGSSVSPKKSLCEWRPLNELLCLATAIYQQQVCYPLFLPEEKASKGDEISLYNILSKVSEFLKIDDRDGLFSAATAMCFSIVCVNPGEVIENFPLLAAIVHHLPKEHIQFLSFILFQREFLTDSAHLWEGVFLSHGALQESNGHENCTESKVLHKCGTTCLANVGSMKCTTVGFSLLLEHAPFYPVFSGLMKYCIHRPFEYGKVRHVLCEKLEGVFTGDWSLPLHFLLFWAYQIRVWHSKKPSSNLEQIFELSLSLVNHILDKVLDQSSHSNVLKAVDLVVRHPVVTLSILCPLFDDVSKDGDLVSGLRAGLQLSNKYVQELDIQVLQLLKRLGELLQVSRARLNSVSNSHMMLYRSVAEAFTELLEQLVLLVKEKFNMYIVAKDFRSLLPTVHIFHALMQFISPFRLLEIVHWMLCKIEDNIVYFTSTRAHVLSFVIDLTSIALENFFNLSNNPAGMISSFSWEPRNGVVLAPVLQNIYRKILEFSICFRLESADACLQKLVNLCFQKSSCLSSVLPSVMQLCRIVMFSSMKLIIHCIHETSKTKAGTLFQLVEASPLHRSLFGMAFLRSIEGLGSSSMDASSSGIMWPPELERISAKYHADISDDNLLLLLPVASSYVTSVCNKSTGQGLKFLGVIPLVYSKILLKVFESWQTYTSGKIFYEDFRKSIKPASVEGLLHCFRQTHLGKAVNMLRLYFISKVRPMKKRERFDIFNSLMDSACSFDQLLDVNLNEIDPFSVEDSFNLVNRAMAKISFAQLLLFPPENSMPSGKTSSSKNSAVLRFLNVLVNSLNNLVKKFSYIPEHCHDEDATHILRLLELHILGTIVQLSVDMKNFLIQLPLISFLNPFMRTLLLHRFDDPTALRAMRIIVCNLETGSSASEFLELLLGHSEFVNTILWNAYNIDLPAPINVGTLLQPVTNIFVLLDEINIKVIDDGSPDFGGKTSYMFLKKLELIKLLRVLFSLKRPLENFAGNSSELLSLLLSGYGATLCEIDLQALYFMHEIESAEGLGHCNISELDYLWGRSAIKVRREKNFNKLLSSNDIADLETKDEQRQRLFRDNIPLDSKRCVMTALNFCYNRIDLTEPISLKSLSLDSPTRLEMPSSNFSEIIPPYDPGFLVPFSIHCLRKGFVEPVEFVRLGLLALVLASISSADEDIRKLGYEALGIFKAILESGRSSRDILQLKLLLAYLQNGITEEYQKIPSITAIFSAEASFILLDPSHNSFQVISKFLMDSSRADFKELPLFHSSFASHSIYFKANFLWMLKLLYVGVNFDDDARILSRKHLYELLMSLYVSSLSDSETKALILQIVKKSIKLPMLATMLVKHHGLIPWLCSVISFNAERLLGDQKEFSVNQMQAALEVITDVVSSKPIYDWLKDDALEQLSDLSQLLHSMLLTSSKSLKDNVSMIDSILSVIILTLKISQERNTSQPHFFLSVEALCQLCRTIECINNDARSEPTVSLGLTTILMSTPPPIQSQMEKTDLLKVATWAVSACLSEPSQKYNIQKTDPNDDDCTLSKLLRWITASIILGSISDKNEGGETGGESLQVLMGKIVRLENEDHDCPSSKMLAAIILHLMYLLGIECVCASSSVVSALSILLFRSCNQKGAETKYKAGNSMSIVSSLWGKIHCPSEVNPSWKWSFHRPWRELSMERTELQELEEEQSCQGLILFLSNALAAEPGSHIQLYQDLEDSGMFTWEKNLLLGNG